MFSSTYHVYAHTLCYWVRFLSALFVCCLLVYMYFHIHSTQHMSPLIIMYIMCIVHTALTNHVYAHSSTVRLSN